MVMVITAVSNRWILRYCDCRFMPVEFPEQEPARTRGLDEEYSAVFL